MPLTPNPSAPPCSARREPEAEKAAEGGEGAAAAAEGEGAPAPEPEEEEVQVGTWALAGWLGLASVGC